MTIRDHEVTVRPSPTAAKRKSVSPELRRPLTPSRVPHCDPIARETIASATLSRMHAATINRSSATRTSGIADFVMRLQRDRGNRYVQRVMTIARKSNVDAEVTPEIEQSIQSARGGGQALDQGVRVQMESAFDSDFSGVRVHTGAQSDVLNQSLNARAFATGQDIFFREGEYRPGSSAGRELLAHELTHVVQQGGGGGLQRKLTLGQPGDQYEQEADAVARAVMEQETKGAAEPTDGGLAQRQPEAEDEIQAKAADGSLLRQIDEEEEMSV